jgi:hypothetical protein
MGYRFEMGDCLLTFEYATSVNTNKKTYILCSES